MPEPRLTADQLRALPVGALVSEIWAECVEFVWQKTMPEEWRLVGYQFGESDLHHSDKIGHNNAALAHFGVHDGRPTRRNT